MGGIVAWIKLIHIYCLINKKQTNQTNPNYDNNYIDQDPSLPAGVIAPGEEDKIVRSKFPDVEVSKYLFGSFISKLSLFKSILSNK